METLLDEIVCPFDAEWKFKKADLMDFKDNENGFLSGKFFYAFNIPGLRYRVKIYQNGHNEEHLGETWIFFHAFSSEGIMIVADYSLSIESANYSKSLNAVCESKKGLRNDICKTAEFFVYKSKYFVNGEITIKVKGTLKVKRSSIPTISSFISAKWKIKENDLKEVMNDESNACLYSEDINAESFFDVKYYLEICPNRIIDENEAATYLSLYVDKGKQKKVEAVVNFSVDLANVHYGMYQVFDNDCGWGISLCSTKDLFNQSKGFLVDGYVTINFHGVLMIEKHRFITLNCKNGSAMKNDEKDFVIIVEEEKEIQIYKNVLSDISPVFAGMLESGMKEAIKNKMYIKDFEFKVVDICVKLCYGNSILLKYSLETLLSIYRFGDKYRIEFITDLIEEYLIKEISPSNVVYLIKLSSPDSLNVKKLHPKCVAFLIKCIKESTPIYAFESIGEKFLAAIILSSLRNRWSKCHHFPCVRHFSNQ